MGGTDPPVERTWERRVCAPPKSGFGLRLLSRALWSVRPSDEILFESTGIVCIMHLVPPSEPLEGDGGQNFTEGDVASNFQLSCCRHVGTHRCSDRIQHVWISATPRLAAMSKG